MTRSDARRGRLQVAAFLVGSVVGAVITVAGRRAERIARRGLVDWAAVERTAIARARRAPGALTAVELRAAEAAYRDAMALVAPRLAAALDTPLTGIVERAEVIDRAGWVVANAATFREVMTRIEGGLLDQVMPPGAGLTKASVAIANRWLTTRQLGFVLGFLATRVLGQYDLTLLSAEQRDGRLLFVEENIRATARALDVPVGPFRTWIALHETTHAFEFEGNAWLRPYLAERLERQIALVSGSAAGLGRDALRGIGRWLRGEGRDEHWMERLMGDEQRRLFRETQAAMSVLEGFSDFVMDEVGSGLVPDVARISERFHERRNRRTPFERAVLRLTGMDLKLEQYERGERFVRAVAEARGRAALQRIWSGPDALPTLEELADPARWMTRVLDGSGA
jgi:coenzyme F420 biosynthesis associated uncharacterized protein